MSILAVLCAIIGTLFVATSMDVLIAGSNIANGIAFLVFGGAIIFLALFIATVKEIRP